MSNLHEHFGSVSPSACNNTCAVTTHWAGTACVTSADKADIADTPCVTSAVHQCVCVYRRWRDAGGDGAGALVHGRTGVGGGRHGAS